MPNCCTLNFDLPPLALTEAGKVGGELATEFFIDEYTLNYMTGEFYRWLYNDLHCPHTITTLTLSLSSHLHTVTTFTIQSMDEILDYACVSVGTCKKPYVALIDGITMGGVRTHTHTHTHTHTVMLSNPHTHTHSHALKSTHTHTHVYSLSYLPSPPPPPPPPTGCGSLSTRPSASGNRTHPLCHA